MNKSYTAGVVQMDSQDDKNSIPEQAANLITEAAQRGAKLIVLPEWLHCGSIF